MRDGQDTHRESSPSPASSQVRAEGPSSAQLNGQTQPLNQAVIDARPASGDTINHDSQPAKAVSLPNQQNGRGQAVGKDEEGLLMSNPDGTQRCPPLPPPQAAASKADHALSWQMSPDKSFVPLQLPDSSEAAAAQLPLTSQPLNEIPSEAGERLP